jgi:lupus La protein
MSSRSSRCVCVHIRPARFDFLTCFQGSVFCEFAYFEDVKKFLEANPKPQWNGNDLLIMSKDAYCEMKIKEKGLTGRAAQYKKDTAKKGFNAFRLDAKSKEKLKEPETQDRDNDRPEIYLEFMGARLKVNQEDGGSVTEADVPFTKGASLKFEGCGGDVKFSGIRVRSTLLCNSCFQLKLRPRHL